MVDEVDIFNGDSPFSAKASHEQPHMLQPFRFESGRVQSQSWKTSRQLESSFKLQAWPAQGAGSSNLVMPAKLSKRTWSHQTALVRDFDESSLRRWQSPSRTPCKDKSPKMRVQTEEIVKEKRSRNSRASSKSKSPFKKSPRKAEKTV